MPDTATTHEELVVELERALAEHEEALRQALEATCSNQKALSDVESRMAGETDLAAYKELEERHAEITRSFSVARNGAEKLKAQIRELEEDRERAKRARDEAAYRELVAQRASIRDRKEAAVAELKAGFEAEAELEHRIAQAANRFDGELANSLSSVTTNRRIKDYLHKQFGSALRGS